MSRFPEVDIRSSKPVGRRNTVFVHIGLKEEPDLSGAEKSNLCRGCSLKGVSFVPVGSRLEARCEGLGKRPFLIFFDLGCRTSTNMAIRESSETPYSATDLLCGADPVVLYRQAAEF